MSPCKCFQKAKSLLESLPPKWNPLTNPPIEIINDDGSDEEDNKNVTTFRPQLITMRTIADAFRIFTEGNECPNVYYHAKNEPNTPDGTMIVYTDGSAIKGGTEEAAAGAGIFYKEDDIRN